MKLVLIAKEETLDNLLNQHNIPLPIQEISKHIVIGAATVVASPVLVGGTAIVAVVGGTAALLGGTAAIGASSSKYSLSKNGLKAGLKDLSNTAKTFISEGDDQKNQSLDIKQKIEALATHLNINHPIYYVPYDEAHHLEFEIGTIPTDGQFYMSHPFLENVFLRPAEFNKALAKEKEVVFLRVAAALGAKSIHLNNVIIHQSSKLFGKKIKPSMIAPNIGIKATFDEKGELIKDIYKQYHKPKKAPYIPEELKQWVKLDPDLRQLAHDRLDLNLASVKVSLQFKENQTKGAEVACALAKKNIEIGGKIEKIQESTWQFHIEFFDKDEIPY